MKFCQSRIVYSLFLMSPLILMVNADLFVSTDSATVSEGTQTSFTCFSDELSDENIFSTGGKVVWSRYPRSSSSLQQVAQYTLANNAQVLLTDPQDAERFSIEGGLDSHTQINLNLVIRQTSKSDQGRYSCILYDGSGVLISQSENLPLTVKYPPADYFPLCSASPVDVGTDVNLDCRSENTTPPVSVQWYKDGTKVADGYEVDTRTTSVYRARQEELGSQFHCRLFYDDGAGVRVERSCRFHRPYVAILRKTEEVNTGNIVFHAFAHSSPPFVSDIHCSLETSMGTQQNFELTFPGYGLMTIGPVSPVDNGTDLVCQAANVFGVGITRMPVYSDGNGNGEATLPSVVTNYMPNDGTLTAAIWPKLPLVKQGENITFVCSHSLEIRSMARTRIAITWRYNGIMVDDTTPRFTATENSLRVDQISSTDEGVSVTCLASLAVEDTPVANIPAGESTTQIRFSNVPTKDDCLLDNNGSTALQSQAGSSSIFRSSAFLFGISALAGVGWLLCVIFILMLIARNRKQNRLGSAQPRRMSSQMTYRAGTTTFTNGTHRGSTPSTNQTTRALPDQPSENPIRNGSFGMRSNNLHVEVPMEPSGPELAYQEMVGNTGVTKSRNGESGRAKGSTNVRSKDEKANDMSWQPELVPGPNGGFIPQEMLANDASSGNKSREHDGAEMNYEDLDCMRHHESQHTRRATGNDYQTSISNTPYLRPQEEEDLLPHYANS
ncbi:uncharacterized protein LOC129269093 [Lytechinus pictus]|uniref:uncharacterized protein LOC129269093 n=1 Tax=Lytechinus pictus TaxID=7653 RepID=UPI0030BA0DC7